MNATGRERGGGGPRAPSPSPSGGERAATPRAPDPGAVDRIHREVLDTVASGVLSLDPEGRVTTLNPAAARMLGIDPAGVVGRPFADLLLRTRGVDALTDLIFESIHDASRDRRATVEIADERGETHTVSASTARIRAAGGGRGGVVAVFEDITEIRTLREAELRRAREAEETHAELRDAYRALEARARDLRSAKRAVRWLRSGGAAVLLALFVAAAFWLSRGEDAPRAGAAPRETGPASAVAVRRASAARVVSIAGLVGAGREHAVTSPVNGTVAEVRVGVGDRVAAGDVLIVLDAEALRHELREARVAEWEAEAKAAELETWEEQVEVSRARRALAKVQVTLETLVSRREETAYLLERGLIPASEAEGAEREYRRALIDLSAAEDDLESVLAQGRSAGRIAALRLESARARREFLERDLAATTVRAPVAGVMLEPATKQREEQPVTAGTAVRAGERLLTLGTLESVSVSGRVDEIDVAALAPGQRATVRGEAFEGVDLEGRVAHVSSQATQPVRGTAPSFEVRVLVEDLTAVPPGTVRLGMSAVIEVEVYRNDNALLVPVDAVRLAGGEARVRVRGADGGVRERGVRLGITTLRGVEVLEGVAEGDMLLAWGP